MSNAYSPYGQVPPQGGPHYPGQGQPGQRFPNYQPPARGPSPPHQQMAARPPTPQGYQQQIPQMLPAANQTVYTYNMGNMGMPISMQYHVMNQQAQSYPNNGQRGPTPGGAQVMGAPGPQSFNSVSGQYGGPGGMQVQYPPQSHPGQMGTSGQPNQAIYSGGPPPYNMNSMPQHPAAMPMFGQRFPIPHQMTHQMPQHQHIHPQISGPPQQGQVVPQGVSQQGAPSGQHQGAPPTQHPQQPQSHIYQQPAPRPQVSSINSTMSTSMNSLPASGPPPATTPPTIPSGPPSLPPQNVSTQPPSTQNTLSRTRKRIAIIDPTTRKEVSVDGTSKTPQVVPPVSTPEQNSASSTPAPESEKSSRPASGVAAEFAAKVAAAAEGSLKKDDSPSSKRETSQGLDESKESLIDTSVVESVNPTETIIPVDNEISIPASPTQVSSEANSTLSVTTDLKREEPMYEPVSPTPLPDSPMDESKIAEVVKPSPFVEVINKKAGVSGIEKREPTEESFSEVKGRKKKESKASKRASLNSKAEKKGDLLDVFTSVEEKSEPIPTVVKKSPTPEPSQAGHKEEIKAEDQPEVNDVSDIIDGVNNIDIVEKPTENTTNEVDLSKNVTSIKEEPVSVDDSNSLQMEVPAPRVNGILDSIPPELMRSESIKSEQQETSEIEEGEIVDDEDNANTDDSKSMKLKYDYKEDQWSPLNPEGKKQYDREFLICLQRDPLSLQKPCNLPNMEIVKDKPNLTKSGGAPSRFDFTPGFVIKTNSRQGINKRGSQGGDKSRGRDNRDQQQKPRMVISLPSISAEVKLNKAENAWKPALKEKKEGVELSEMEELKKKVLSILNKLTPQKFQTLVEKFQELPIDTQDKLSMCMELVFEKAVDEPAFSVAYAQMCKVMQMKKVPVADGGPEEYVNFRKLLISRCQKEFEKDYMDSIDRDKYVQDMNAADNEEAKKKVKMEFEQMEMKARRRSLGNIRFIGELYKLQMLTARIMHECVKKLLTTTDDESLECLCRLVTTVGKALEDETNGRLSKGPVQGINNLDVYFKEMSKLVDQRKTSSRVRFLMQDVIDLKLNNWKKRREDAGPKTIDQIHKEIEKEQLELKLAHLNPMGPPPTRRDERRADKNDRNDDRRRSQKGPGVHAGGHSGEDGWQAVPTRAARSTFEKIDTNKIRNISQTVKTDVDSMSFGPPKMGGGTWGRGSQSAKTSRQEQPSQMQNRFAQLEQNESAVPQAYDGRSSGGSRFGRQNSQQGGYAGRNSRGGSGENDRAKAIQAARDFGGNRSQSVMGPHPTISRENSAPRSASMVVQKKPEIPEVPLRGPPNASRGDIEKWTDPLLNEFLHNVDYDEAIKEIGEKFSSGTIAVFVETVFNQVIERSEKARSLAGNLLSQLVKKRMVTETQYLEGLDSLLSIADEMLVDVPKFWDFMANIVAPVLSSGALGLKILKESATKANLFSGDMGKRCAAGKYTAAVLHEMGKSGHNPVAQLWRQSGLQWSDFLTSDTSVDEFLLSNKLEWTTTGGDIGEDMGELSDESLGKEIAKVLASNRKSNDTLFDWIEKHCSARLSTPSFIRVLTTVVMESVIDGIGGPTNVCKLNEEQIRLRNPVLLRYLNNNQKLEMQALLSLQYLMHRLEHPNKLLHSIFEKMYDDDVLSEESFMLWEKNNDPAEQEGKGVALKSCTQFFTWLQEAEEEDD